MIGAEVIRKKDCFCSSLDWAKENFYSAQDGTIFLADEYHFARGQKGRVWKIYPGQLILTFILKPKKFEKHFDSLNRAIALGISDPILKYGVKIKLPNDFMIKRKKVGGMLTEVIWDGNKALGLVTGFAINCNNEFDKNDELCNIATSLKSACNKQIEINLLYSDILSSINFWYMAWSSGNFRLIDRKFSGRKNYFNEYS